MTGYAYRGRPGLAELNEAIRLAPRETRRRQPRPVPPANSAAAAATESAASRKRKHDDQAAADVLAILKLLAARCR